MSRARLRLAALLCVLLFLLPMLVTVADAKETDRILPDLLDILPGDAKEELDGKTDPDAVGELLGLEYLASLILSSLETGLSSSLDILGTLLAATLLMGILSLAAKHLEGGAARAAECGIGVVLTVLVFRIAEADVALATATLSDMRRFSDGLVPLFASLFATGGSVGTATAAATGFATFSYLLETVVIGLLSPMLYLLFAFTAMSALGGNAGLDGLFRTVKGVYLSILGFSSVLLVTALGFQSTLSASADSLAAGSVRFAVGNLIPIVGGTLGGSLRTLSASLSLLRGTVGTLSVVALLLSVLPVLVTLLLHRLFLSLAADLSGVLGAQVGQRILAGFRGIYDLAVATLSLATVIFFLILGILSHCAGAVG